MPSLVAFGRRWNIASDDFVFPELTEGFIRLIWIGFALAVFIYHYPLNCTLKDFSVPVIILLVINVVTLCLAFSTAGVSARGTIMITRPRRHVSTLLYIRLPILVLEFCWTIYSTVAVFESYIDHSNSSVPQVATLYGNFTADSCQFATVIKFTVGLEWLLFVCAIIGIVVVFHPKSDEDVEDITLISRRVWSRRFRIFKIRQDELMRAALDDLANLFASFFHTSDIVFSDVLAGLLLVVHSPGNEYPPLVPLETAERPDWMTEENALHYLHFAASVYGWPTFLFNNFGCGSCFRLGRRLQFCGKLNCGQILIVEDNCCFCNTAALILENEERNVDLFYVSFRNRLYEVPFAVLADHQKKSIVLTIRGSCSISDLITDLCLKEEVLSEDVDADPILRQDPSLDPRDGGEVRVHKGMLQSARFIYRTLQNNKTIEDMFMLNPEYQLVVCGHSLGAGVASLLTLFLKQKYPSVQCFAYAPPGCVVSQEGIAEMEKHCMSVVSGDDVISRISFQAMYRVREKVEHELRACQRAKYEILLKGVFRLFWKNPWEEHPLSGSRRNLENSDRSELIVTSSTGLEYGSSHQTTSRRSSDDRIQLFAPGRILYVGMEEEKAVKKWIDPRCLSDIKLSTSALTDHLPKNVLRILKAAIAEDSAIPESAVEEPSLDISIA